jgi:hypothetical protein
MERKTDYVHTVTAYRHGRIQKVRQFRRLKKWRLEKGDRP